MQKLIKFFSEFIFGFSLKSYTFTKYKTLDKEKLNSKINTKIITSYKNNIENNYNDLIFNNSKVGTKEIIRFY